jgi:hypothetical protein
VRPLAYRLRGSGFCLVPIAIFKPNQRQISSTSVKYIHTLLTSLLAERVYCLTKR